VQHWAKATDPAGGVLLWYTLRNDGLIPIEVGGFSVEMPCNEQVGGSLSNLAGT
jgi:hypothetical protein